MADRGETFSSEANWEDALKSHYKEVVDSSCWGRWLDVNGVPLLPLIRAINQPFQYPEG